jgi:hypothetical protein
MQHFLKPFTINISEMQFQDIMIHVNQLPYFPVDNARVNYTKTFSERKKMTVRVIQWMRIMQLK